MGTKDHDVRRTNSLGWDFCGVNCDGSAFSTTYLSTRNKFQLMGGEDTKTSLVECAVETSIHQDAIDAQIVTGDDSIWLGRSSPGDEE